jgi:hypothetical protein
MAQLTNFFLTFLTSNSGYYSTFQGERYILLSEENFKKINSLNHEYTLEMDTYAAYLRTQKFEFFTLTRYQGVETINSDR